jgi:hypothetical protein
MGLSIHYSGSIKQHTMIDDLVDEVSDICKSFGWTYHLFDGNNADKIKGICFSPQNCEPIFLTFLPKGRMCSPVNLSNKDIYKENGLDEQLLFTTSTKTQFAGPNAHMAIIRLLLYLKQRYFATFELDDEGKYWETMDEKILLKQFARYDYLLNAVTEVLSNMKAIPGETTQSLAERMEQLLNKKLKNI